MTITYIAPPATAAASSGGRAIGSPSPSMGCRFSRGKPAASLHVITAVWRAFIG